MTDFDKVIARTQELATRYIDSLEDRPVAGAPDRNAFMALLGGPLPETSSDPAEVVQELADAADDGVVATSSGRFFGFVEGGVLPASLGADWLASTWDQNPAFHTLSPAGAMVEEVAAGWLLDILGLPPTASVGFTTGAQMANFAGLATARQHLLAQVGWDVGADGLMGAPPLTVVVGAERHATVDRALRFLGIGERTASVVDADRQGAMVPAALGSVLKEANGPVLVCAQAGNVNTGASDPFQEIAQLCKEHGAWLHVDGAFGLWAAASPAKKHLVAGVELADSWATDGHKWLNVPYDSGIVMCAHPEAHRAAMALRAPYLVRTADTRDGSDWTPESSRRGRAFAIWAALKSLGRTGVAEMVERCCAHAERFAERLAVDDDIEVINEVVLNQVMIRVGDDDERTRKTAQIVQESGRVWLGDTTRHGRAAIRISVSDHATTTQHVDLAIDEIRSAAAASAAP